MIKNFFKVAIRNITQHKSYIFINVAGLAIGIACSILIILFVVNEFSYDRFNKNKDRIYRLVLKGKIGEAELNSAYTAAPIGPIFRDEIPGVENATRLEKWGEVVVKFDDKSFVEKDMIFVDSTFFDIFTLPLLQGNPQKVLTEPHTVVLSESTAKSFFGNEDPIGKSIKINTDTAYYTVTGVVIDPPVTSHFGYSMIASISSDERSKSDFWLSNFLYTYLLLAPDASYKDVEDKFPGILEKYMGPQLQQVLNITIDEFEASGNSYGFYLQPLLDIHMNPSVEAGLRPTTDKKYVYIFSIIALLILVIASINYMNLSTARSAGRAREVGVRKVVGSSKATLIRQFLVESVLLSFISLILAIVLIEITLPYFNNMIQLHLSMQYLKHWYIIPGLILLSFLVGTLAGSYPAFFLASFSPIKVLTGKLNLKAGSGWLRSVLVVLQFSISILIILGTIIISRQIHYMLNKDLGFNKEQLMVIRRAEALGDKQESFRQEVKKYPGVISCSYSTSVPGYPNNNNGYTIEGRNADQTYLMQINWIDEEYPETYGLKIADGRFFSKEYASDTAAIVINQMAVKKFNLEKPLSTRFIQPGMKPEERVFLHVIGVVKDFHITSLQQEIQPCAFILKHKNSRWGYISIRVAPKNIPATVNYVQKTWKSFTSNDPIQYFFMDEDFQNQYKQERRTSDITLGFAIFSILIAALGLFGLTSYTTEQRTREIGLRKALGASGSNVIVMLLKEIILLISISTVIAWVVAYFVMKNWLQDFYYRIDMSAISYIAAFIIALIIALITVSYKAYIASHINPAQSLKYE